MNIGITIINDSINITNINYVIFNSNGRETIVIFKHKKEQKVEVFKGWLSLNDVVEKLSVKYL